MDIFASNLKQRYEMGDERDSPDLSDLVKKLSDLGEKIVFIVQGNHDMQHNLNTC